MQALKQYITTTKLNTRLKCLLAIVIAITHVANTSRHVMHAATSSYVASIQAHNSGCLAILCAIATH